MKVIRLVVKDTVDEHILNISERKTWLTEAVLQDEERKGTHTHTHGDGTQLGMNGKKNGGKKNKNAIALKAIMASFEGK